MYRKFDMQHYRSDTRNDFLWSWKRDWFHDNFFGSVLYKTPVGNKSKTSILKSFIQNIHLFLIYLLLFITKQKIFYSINTTLSDKPIQRTDRQSHLHNFHPLNHAYLQEAGSKLPHYQILEFYYSAHKKNISFWMGTYFFARLHFFSYLIFKGDLPPFGKSTL